MNPGIFYIIATPIGNMEDITLRAVRILGEVDALACEDTRQTLKIYNHYNIKKPEIRFPYHEHNELQMVDKIISLLKDGKSVALCSDAGYPGISDPGYRIMAALSKENLPAEVIPGASAVPVALLSSGLPVSSYTFKGFAPKKSGQRINFLKEEAALPHTLVLYESPHRIHALLKDAFTVFGNRQAAVCIELTKKFQRISRNFLKELVMEFEDKTIKGEITVVICGNNSKFLIKDEEEQTGAASPEPVYISRYKQKKDKQDKQQDESEEIDDEDIETS